MARSKTSAQWLKEHFHDPYVKQSQIYGYRSRASYKLLEIQKKDKLFKKNVNENLFFTCMQTFFHSVWFSEISFT